jgi:predicted DNA-binding transcriptional regulator YafY
MDKKVYRVFSLIQILVEAQYPLTIADIEDRLLFRDITVPSRRTVFRDLNDISALGYKITLPGKRGTYQIQNKSDFAGSFFTQDMIQALHMGRGIFQYFDDTIFKDTIDRAIRLITGATAPVGSQCDTDGEHGYSIRLGPVHNYSPQKESIDEIINSIYAGYTLHITYEKPGKGCSEFVLEPYGMIIYRDSLYVLGRKEQENILKIFHVSRIKKAQQGSDTFTVQRSLQDDYFQRAYYAFGIMTSGSLETVRISFDPSCYFVRERCWHPSQEIEHGQDGTVVLSMRVLVNEELITWILGLSGHVRSIEPAFLRDKVRKKALQMSKI